MRYSERRCLSVVAALLTFCSLYLAGCGGGGGGGDQQNLLTRTLKVPISWDARSSNRAIGAPSSALSATGVLAGASLDGTDYTFTINRHADPAAYAATETINKDVKAGAFAFKIDFHANPDGGGPVVATAQAQVTVKDDGTGIDQIIVPTTVVVSSVVVAPNQIVKVGDTKDIIFTAFNANNTMVAVTQGSAIFTIVSGTDTVQLVNGQVRGLAAGTARVQATVDRVTSPAVDITVATSITDVTPLLTAGRAALSDILAGRTTTSVTSLQNVFNIFNNAHSQNSSDPQAGFGFALSSIALRAQVVVDRAQGRAVPTRGRDALPTSDVLSAAASQATLSGVTAQPVSGDTLSIAISAPFAMSQLSRAVNAAQLRSAVNDLKSALDTAIPVVESDAGQPGFAFALTDNNGSFVIDQGDVQTFVAGLYVARATLQIALSYNTDFGSFDFSQSIGSKFGTPLIAGTSFGPDVYLPPAPFGTLNSDGTALFAAAKSDLSTAADRAATAVSTLQNRTGQTRHLIPQPSSQNVTQINAGINSFRLALNSPFQAQLTLGNGSTTTVSINMNAWFTNPPPSLRALLPTYRVDSFGRLATTANDFPDKTFGGLLVNVPDSTFTTSPVNTSDSVGSLVSHGLPRFSVGG